MQKKDTFIQKINVRYPQLILPKPHDQFLVPQLKEALPLLTYLHENVTPVEHPLDNKYAI